MSCLMNVSSVSCVKLHEVSEIFFSSFNSVDLEAILNDSMM